MSVHIYLRSVFVIAASITLLGSGLSQAQVVAPIPRLEPALSPGACCRPDGSCVLTTVLDCNSVQVGASGYFLGNGTTCSPGICAASVRFPTTATVPSWQPTAISGDGRTVVGMTPDASRGVICRDINGVWNVSLLPAGLGQPTAVNANGSKVVGRKSGVNLAQGFIFNVATQAVTTLVPPAGASMVIPWGISPSGNYIAGAVMAGSRTGIARWNGDGTGFQNHTNWSVATAFGVGRAVTDTGEVAGESHNASLGGVVGYVNGVSIPDLAGGPSLGSISTISTGGQIGFGFGTLANGHKRLVRWTSMGGLVDISEFAADYPLNSIGFRTLDVRDATADGTRAIGDGNHDGLRQTWIWRQSWGLVELDNYVRTRFPATTRYTSYPNGRGISDDAKTLCGFDYGGPNSSIRPWIIRLPDVRR